MGRALARVANTPRPLIQAIVQVMKPDPRAQPDFRICDPACGTGGFLVSSYEWLVSKDVSGGVFDRADAKRIKSQTFIGQDLVPRPRRLALMNLFLHGVEPHIYLGDAIYEPDRPKGKAALSITIAGNLPHPGLGWSPLLTRCRG